MWLWSLIGGVKGLAILALVLALGGWAANKTIQLNRAESARDQAIAQRDQAAVQRDKAIEAAKTNEQTIARLEDEKKNLNQALNSLEAARQVNRANTVTRQVTIQREAGVPANAAQAAPVLGTIIKEVQADRYRRRGITPPPTPTTTSAERLRQ